MFMNVFLIMRCLGLVEKLLDAGAEAPSFIPHAVGRQKLLSNRFGVVGGGVVGH